MHTSTHTCKHTYISVSYLRCMCVCMCVCMCIHTYMCAPPQPPPHAYGTAVRGSGGAHMVALQTLYSLLSSYSITLSFTLCPYSILSLSLSPSLSLDPIISEVEGVHGLFVASGVRNSPKSACSDFSFTCALLRYSALQYTPSLSTERVTVY